MKQKLKEPSIEIKANEAAVTLINIIRVEPKNYSKLMLLLKEGTDKLFSKQTGFIAVAIQSNKEENTIILYGQWKSTLDIENFRKVPEIQTYFKSLLEIAKFESIICNNIPYINSHSS